MTATAIGATLDQEEIKRIDNPMESGGRISIRPDDSLPTEHAIRVLVGQDVPSLLKEVIHLRPDLA